jgi:hypothetical protein
VLGAVELEDSLAKKDAAANPTKLAHNLIFGNDQKITTC